MENYFDRHQKKMEMGPHEENQKYLNVCYNSVDELKVVEIHLDHDSSYLLKTLYIHYHYNKMHRLRGCSASFYLIFVFGTSFCEWQTFLTTKMNILKKVMNFAICNVNWKNYSKQKKYRLKFSRFKKCNLQQKY